MKKLVVVCNRTGHRLSDDHPGISIPVGSSVDSPSGREEVHLTAECMAEIIRGLPWFEIRGRFFVNELGQEPTKSLRQIVRECFAMGSEKAE